MLNPGDPGWGDLGGESFTEKRDKNILLVKEVIARNKDELRRIVSDPNARISKSGPSFGVPDFGRVADKTTPKAATTASPQKK
jgi:hypothetical protein